MHRFLRRAPFSSRRARCTEKQTPLRPPCGPTDQSTSTATTQPSPAPPSSAAHRDLSVFLLGLFLPAFVSSRTASITPFRSLAGDSLSFGSSDGPKGLAT